MKPHKYHAKSCVSKYGVRTDAAGKRERTCDGILFASKREMARYRELKLLEKAGEIFELELQRRFLLKVGEHTIGSYVADFWYCTKEGQWITEDVKGMQTPLYKWKAKHMTAQYGIAIRVIR